MNSKLLTLGCIILFLSCNAQEKSSNSIYHRKMPYPESDLIAFFKWNSEPYKYLGTGSDMHWWTWRIDDAVYVLDDDGKNFEGPINYAHVLKVNATPPDHKIETLTNFMEIPFPKMMPADKMLNRYVDGIIAVNSLLYVSIYDYDWNLERNLPYFDSIRPRLELYDCFADVRDSTMLRNMWFSSSYSKNYGIAGIIKSTDFGKTWTNLPNATTPRFLGPKFAGLTFLKAKNLTFPVLFLFLNYPDQPLVKDLCKLKQVRANNTNHKSETIHSQSST